MPSRLLRLLAALLASGLLLGACGGDDDDEPDDTSGSTSTSSTVAADDADDGDGDDETEVDAGDETDADGETDEGAAAFDPAALEAIDDFCQLGSYGDEISSALTTDNPDAMRESALFMATFYARAAEIAPDEISADIDAVTASLGQQYALAEDYEYDFEAMRAAAAADPELQERLDAVDSPEATAARDRVSEWVDANCPE
ncbi:MAG: hypothetical protein JJE52_14965 [Acidimicrobiia bacterium]|nr:hypothetical protein [Acidimicrobiia bacterium]